MSAIETQSRHSFGPRSFIPIQPRPLKAQMMKVRELINDLSTYNLEAEVSFWVSASEKLSILSIYSGDLKKDSSVYDAGDPDTDPDVIFDMGGE